MASEGMPGPRKMPFWRQALEEVVPATGAILGGISGAAAGTVAAPSIVVNPISGAIAGGALGYGTGKQALRALDVAMGNAPAESLPQELARTAKGVGEGALYEVGGGVAAKAANKLVELTGKGIGKVVDINQLPKVLAGKIARESFESPEAIKAAQQALKTAPEGVTAQQALAGKGLILPTTQAVLDKAIAKTMPTAQATKEAAQKTARETTLRSITPDLEAAVKTRKQASTPLYEAADKARVAIDDELGAIIDRMPSGTLAKAAEIAKMEGKPFIIGSATPAKMVETGVLDAAGKPIMQETPATQAEISGQALHYIKRALSDIAYGPLAVTGAGRDTQLAAQSLLKDYLSVFEKKVPEYGQARRIFSDLSAPVNQAQVLKEMASILEKPGGGERIGPFLNVLGRGEEAMLKRAGGRGGPRFEALSEVLTPDQLSKVMAVAKQLETESAIGQQISAGRQRASDLIKEELPNQRLPNIFNVVATTVNKMLDTLGVVVGKKTIEKLAASAQTAKSFDELINTLPAEERSKLLKAMSNPDTWATIGKVAPKAAMVLGAEKTFPASTNNLAAQPENQNALRGR
jgi:hypothetical protein